MNGINKESSYFLSDGEMGELIRTYDWARTSLGPLEAWPGSLRTTLGIMLHSAFPMFLFWGEELTCFYNDPFRPSLGIDGKHPAVGKKGKDVWPEIWDFIGPLIGQVMATGKPVWFEDQLVPFYRNSRVEDIYWTFSYSPVYDDGGRINGVVVTCTETTRSVQTLKHLEESEKRFRSIVEQSPMAIALLRGRDMVVEHGNDAIFQVWGKTREVIGKGLLDALPEIKNQVFMSLLQEVYDTGKPFFGNGTLARLERNGRLEDAYFNFAYTPVRTADAVSGIMVLATEVTELVVGRKTVEESAVKLKAVIEATPAAMSLFTGPELVVEMPNQAFLDIASRGREIIGRPLRDAMPELIDQPFLRLLDNVYRTGEPFHAEGMPGEIIQDGIRTPHFFDFSYIPLTDPEGNVYSILDVTIDVTREIINKKKLEESETHLKQAIEVAGLASWTIDAKSSELRYSGRLYEWFGVDPAETGIQEVFALVESGDRQRVEHAVAHALTPGSSGIFDEEFTIRNRDTGRKRIVHSQGKIILDMEGKPAKLVGSVQDITVYRQLQLALEQEIQERTEQLDLTNEELQAANEELAATNEELAQSNDNLTLSNQDLQQFAHVASHDLKEPVRKIKTFLSRMELDKGNILSAKSRTFLEKINHSASRMEAMIEGVLNYSRLDARDQKLEDVSIDLILGDVAADLEIPITEKGAFIEQHELPQIAGSRILLYQLFYNLIANALKFSVVNRPPRITITSALVLRNKIEFYKIQVADNGIGFEQTHAEKIFNTFAMLNRKDQYEGTGLGLALCKKIALRHHGFIEAYGEKDKGARFVIFLPKHQLTSFI